MKCKRINKISVVKNSLSERPKEWILGFMFQVTDASRWITDKLNHDQDVTTTGAAMSRHGMLFPEIPCRFENCKACYRLGVRGSGHRNTLI